jgi:sugar/nucleoside kinase (ribokinase family)
VSVEKLLRHSDVLKNLFLLSGNEDEFRALGKIYTTEGDDKKIEISAGRGSQSDHWVQIFLEERRIEQLLVTRGRRGVRLYRRDLRPATGRRTSQKQLNIPSGRIIDTGDTTGAGDRLLSEFLETIDREAAIEEALRQAVRSVERAIEEGNL